MDEVTGGFLRIIVYIPLIIMFISGVVLAFKKSSSKKVCAVLIIIPLLLTYTMYFSGSFRRAPFTKASVEALIDEVCDPNYSKFDEKITAENGDIEYTVRLIDDKFSTVESDDILGKAFDKIFGKEGTYKDRRYIVTDVCSYKGAFWESSCHDRYKGLIYIKVSEKQFIKVDYTISRKIDRWVGFFYAPPLIKRHSFV